MPTETATEKADSPSAHKTRWFRFSLRTFLILVTLLCVWIGVLANRARTQRITTEKLRAMGVYFDYDHRLDLVRQWTGVAEKSNPQKPLPTWLSNIIGDEYAQEVWIINTSKNVFKEEHLALIDNLPHLRFLCLDNNERITDDGMRHFAKLTKLNFLSINKAKINGSGLRYLKGIQDLRALTVSDSDVNDDAMELICEFKNITRLDLRKTKITDDGLAQLKSLPKLSWLDISDNSITAEGLKQLADIKTLRRLFVGSGMKEISNVRKWFKQRLPRCQIETEQ